MTKTAIIPIQAAAILALSRHFPGMLMVPPEQTAVFQNVSDEEAKVIDTLLMRAGLPVLGWEEEAAPVDTKLQPGRDTPSEAPPAPPQGPSVEEILENITEPSQEAAK